MPRWLRRISLLIGIYAVVVAAAALWLPHEWDWSFNQWLSARAEPVFSRQISIIDVPWNPSDVPSNRHLVGAFLRALATSGARPAAVILDIEFDPCQTQPCTGPMASARDELVAAIRSATKVFPVYATEEPQVDRNDDVVGPLDRHDELIYGALTGAAQTRFGAVPDAQGIFYPLCYPDVSFVDELGNVIGTETVWSMVERVSPEFSSAACDTSRVVVRLGLPLKIGDPPIYRLRQAGTLPNDARLDKQYVIVGPLAYDRSPYVDRTGPEVLGWALSNRLELGSASNARGWYATQPQNEMLLAMVPLFSALTVLAFAAVFFPIKRTRLRAFRHRLPLAAAAIAGVIGLGLFAAFEVLMYATHQIYPQVTLITFGVVLASGLSGYRGYEILSDESNQIEESASESHDYDVFISYAHEEGAWVFENVYAPFRDARLPDGRKLSVFFDTSSIRSGTSWQSKLALAIDGSRFIVPIYSELYFKKPYCRFEIMRAHRKWVLAGQESRCVMPIMRGHPKILPAVDDIQALSLDDHPDLIGDILGDILAALR